MGRLAQQTPGLEAARDGRSICRHIADTTITNAFVVQTAATTYYDIPDGSQVVVSQSFVGCETADEFMAGYVVGCAEITGGGAATQVCNQIHDHVGAKKEGSGHVVRDYDPPLVLKYSDGHRSVSMAVKATDAATVCSFGWSGWYEDEGTLS